MQIDVYDAKYEKVGKVDVPDEVFASEVNEALLWETVKAQRASRRAGTHKTKKRGEVSGGGIKPFKQKGTGRARQGSIRAPNHVGGGKVFGPVPRDYSYRLPRSARKVALRSALSLRAKDGLIVLDSFTLDAPKTKAVVEFLGQMGTTSALIVDSDNHALKLSTRNLPETKYLAAGAINVYDVLDYDKLVLTKAALADVIRVAMGEKAEA